MIKLNIQRFSSTNKTTHYDLSQYVASDKPTYLTDYNGDMLKIDAGINAAKTTADTASTAATNAQTAAETAQTTANTAVTNAAAAQSSANTAITNIGTLANLETATKTNVVAAVNEVVANIGNKNNLETSNKTDLVSALNEIFDFIHLTEETSYNVANLTTSGGSYNGTIKLKKDSTGKVFKIYGSFDVSNVTGNVSITIPNTGISVESNKTFDDVGLGLSNVSNTYRYPRKLSINISTDGTLTINAYSFEDNTNMACILFDTLYIV